MNNNDYTQKEEFVNNTISSQIIYTVKEVSQILKTNIDYVYSLRKAGLLPFIKIGQYKVMHKSLIQFLEKYEGYDLTDPFNIKKLNDN